MKNTLHRGVLRSCSEIVSHLVFQQEVTGAEPVATSLLEIHFWKKWSKKGVYGGSLRDPWGTKFCSLFLKATFGSKCFVAQGKRVGFITQRSEDQNLPKQYSLLKKRAKF